MSNDLVGQMCSPPDLPSYLKDIYDLKPIFGVASDEEVIGIHTVMQVAQKAADIPGMGDRVLLARLSEYLFNVQLARYRSKYLCATLPEDTIYTPPTVPSHVAVQLEPVNNAPSEEEVIKVQDAIRSYNQFANDGHVFSLPVTFIPTDFYLAKYTQRARHAPAISVVHGTSTATTGAVATKQTYETDNEESATNNPGTGAHIPVDLNRSVCTASGTSICDPESSSQHIEQSNKLNERFNELFERFNEHIEQSNQLAELSIKPVEKLEGVLRNINKVLVGIQHAIVRTYKDNTLKTADCLINEKGEIPGQNSDLRYKSFEDLSRRFRGRTGCRLPVVIKGVTHDMFVDDEWLGLLLRFYGVAEDYFESDTSTKITEGFSESARIVFGRYLSACLG